MGPLHTVSAPPPSPFVLGGRPPVASAYFAVTVDAAVDLLEAREYQGMSRPERMAKAQAEQQAFLAEFLDPGLRLALDLRVAADPAASTPVSVTLLGRVWDGSASGATARAERLRAQVHAALPSHVAATPVQDAATVTRLLTPFGGDPVDSAVITRHELIGLPERPDAGVSYYYSAIPFQWSDNDWSAVYAALAASPVPVVLSVAVAPMTVPPQFAQTLRTLASFYGLATEGETHGGPYQGRQRLAPDPFAVDAEQAFLEYSRRLAQHAFALRVQVSAARLLPPGIVETIAGVITTAERPGGLLGQRRALPAYDVRRPSSAAERRLAQYNLNVVNVAMLTGRPEIWERPDPPDPQLALLTVLGDARDAACAFRFPIAADGIVPGFRVRRGQFGQAGAGEAARPVIRLGQVSGTDRPIAVPLRSLAGHALIAGVAGSGKTTTALEVLRQLWAEHHVPFLVLDPASAGAGDYRRLAGEPGFEALDIVTAGDEGGRPLRFNPFEVPAGTAVGEHAANLLACFAVAFGLSGALPPLYADALSLTYLRAGFLATEKPDDARPDDARPDGAGRAWPTVTDFLAAMEEVAGGLGTAGEVKAEAASVRRARQLVRGAAGSAFLTDRPSDIGRLLDRPVVVELGALRGDEQALVMALLLNAVTEHCRSARRVSADLAHVTLVEEAHRLLGRAPDGAPGREARARERAAAEFAGTLAGNRRYGEGVIITGQAPGKLVPDAVKQANLKIMHRLTAEDDRRPLGEATGMNEAQRALAARLRPGEALLYSDEFAETAHADITPALPPDEPRQDAVRRTAAAPFAACDACRARCAYRGAALSMLNDPRIVADIASAALPSQDEAGLTELRRRLHDTVGRFAALPSAEPGRADAAFCLFLHVHASTELRFAPGWPAAAARLLGVTEPGADAGTHGDTGRAPRAPEQAHRDRDDR